MRDGERTQNLLVGRVLPWVVISTFLPATVSALVSFETQASAQEHGRVLVSTLSPRELASTCTYQFCKSFTAIPNNSVFAVGVFYINSACQYLGLGSFSEIVSPIRGTLQFGTLNLVPSCSSTGTAIPATVAYYTWTKHTPSKIYDDAFALQYTTDDGQQGLSIGLDAELQPSGVSTISPECTAALDGAKVGLHLVNDIPVLPFKKPQIVASFVPQGGIEATAQACGFKVSGKIKGFDWVQVVETYSQPTFPSTYQAPDGSCPPLTLPYNDPPLYGYCSEAFSYYSFPFYLSTYRDDVSIALANYEKTDVQYCPTVDEPRSEDHFGDVALCFADRPQIDNIHGKQHYDPIPYVLFRTSLVGIIDDGSLAGVPSDPIAQWVWVDTFRHYKAFSLGNIDIISTSSNVTLEPTTNP